MKLKTRNQQRKSTKPKAGSLESSIELIGFNQANNNNNTTKQKQKRERIQITNIRNERWDIITDPMDV